MKRFIRLLVSFVIIAAVSISVVGCGGSQVVDNTVEDEHTLKVIVINKGYGTNWLKKIKASFEEKYAEDDITVEVTEVYDDLVTATSWEAGEKLNDYDLYIMVAGSNIASMYEAQKNKWGYDNGLMDYSDIYNSEVPGEGILFKDKVIDSVLREQTVENGKQYSVSWALGIMGMMYNKDTLNDVYPDGYTLPQTTNDFIQMCRDVKAKGYTPVVYPGKLNQLQCSLCYPLWQQYEGIDGVDNFYNARWYNEDTETWEAPSKNVLMQQGILESLKFVCEIADKDNGYVFNDVLSYDGTNFRNLQVKFFSKSEHIAFYPCGDWLEQETASTMPNASDIGMMKTPILSNLYKVLDTVANETELKEIISYVDGDTDTINPKYSESDIQRVRDGRNTYYTKSPIHYCYSPVYCNAKSLVKKFLLYMATDEAIKTYKENVMGGFIPFKYDYSDMELIGVSADVGAIISNCNVLCEFGSTKYALMGGLGPFHGSPESTIDYAISASHDNKYYLSATQIYEGGFMTDSEWANMLRKCAV